MKIDKKQKPHGMKHKIREDKKREERIGLAVIVAILIAIISVSGFFIHSMLTSSPQNQEPSSTSEPRAAIVDHLSLTATNRTFVETATNILQQAGFTVDYYSGEKVTVEFYRNLPTHGYGLIVLRVHSGICPANGLVALFTSEPYSTTKYVYEQLTDQMGKVRFGEAGPTYFGINHEFIKQSMKGKFQNSIVIMMGCNGLTYTKMAKAFIEKGAKVYISWNQPVSASHTDLATSHLLQYFLIEKLTLKETLRETFRQVGTDPTYKSLLIYYPPQAGDYTFQNIIGSLISNPTKIKTQHSQKKDMLRALLHRSMLRCCFRSSERISW